MQPATRSPKVPSSSSSSRGAALCGRGFRKAKDQPRSKGLSWNGRGRPMPSFTGGIQMYASQPKVASATLRRATGCAVAFALIALVSCGGDDYNAPASVTPPAGGGTGGTGVTGNAYLGPIVGATASLFNVNPTAPTPAPRSRPSPPPQTDSRSRIPSPARRVFASTAAPISTRRPTPRRPTR